MQVLIVADSETDFQTTKGLGTARHDFTFHESPSLETGLAVLAAQMVDVLLLDAHFCTAGEPDPIRTIQTQFPHLTIIILSHTYNTEMALQAIRSGAQDYLIKGTFDQHGLEKSLYCAVERKRIERDLRQSEAQFHSSFTYAAIGKALVALDGRLLQVNRALCDILGYSEAEILSQTRYTLTYPADAEADANEVRQLLNGNFQSYQLEKRYIHKDGHLVWCLLNQSLVRDSSGNPSLFISQIQDISRRKDAEAALAAERNLLRTIIDSIPDYVYVKDPQGRLVIVNQSVVGYAEAVNQVEILGKTDFDFYPPDVARRFYDDEQHVLTTGQMLLKQEERSLDLRTGRERWFSTTKIPLRDEQGTIIGLLGVSWDITERKQAEQLLQKQLEDEQVFQNYLKALHDITVELTTIADLDTFYKRAVELGLERLGFDRLGLLLYDPDAGVAQGTYGTDGSGKLVAEYHIRFDPSQLTSILQRALEEDERYALDENAPLFSNMKPIGTGWNAAAVLWYGTEKLGWLAADNGTQHQPFATTQLNLLALYAATLGTLLVQKRAHLAIEDSERRLRLLIQNSPDVIYILSLTEGRADYLNRPEFLGYSREEIENEGSLINALHPAHKEAVVTHWRAVTAQGKLNHTTTIEYQLRAKDGSWHWIQSRETIFATDAQEKPTQILVTLTDISERRLLEKQTAELADERRRISILQQFIDDMSHDFRTPLSTVNNSLYLMQKNTDPERQRLYAERAAEQIRRMDKLLDELLQMNRLDNNETIFQFEETDINQLLHQIAETYEIPARLKHITIEFASDGQPCMARIDAVEFARAITKLMDNALIYTTDGGRVTVRAKIENNWAVFSITDTGMGIATDDLPHIFERFYRADQARSTITGGSGLGLTIVQKIIEAHHGEIEVESVLAQGTTFVLKVPSQ